jgi:hypothetical protein
VWGVWGEEGTDAGRGQSKKNVVQGLRWQLNLHDQGANRTNPTLQKLEQCTSVGLLNAQAGLNCLLFVCLDAAWMLPC